MSWRDAAAFRTRLARSGRDGVDGISVDPSEVRALVEAGIERVRAEQRNGVDGRDADPASVATMVVAAIASTMRAADGEPQAPRPWRLIPYRDENTDLIQYIDLIPL